MDTHKLIFHRKDAKTSGRPRFYMDLDASDVEIHGERWKRRDKTEDGNAFITRKVGDVTIHEVVATQFYAPTGTKLPKGVTGLVVEVPAPTLTFTKGTGGAGGDGGSSDSGYDPTTCDDIAALGDEAALAEYLAATVPGMAGAKGKPTAAAKRLAKARIAKAAASDDS